MKILYLRRTASNRCPRCGNGPVIQNIFHRFEACSECKLEYSREDGFFLGGVPIAYGLICGLWIVPIIIAWSLNWLSYNCALWLGLIGAVAWPMLIYRYCQCLWLGLYFIFAESEMPNQQEEVCPEQKK